MGAPKKPEIQQKALHGFEQAQVTLFDEVEEGKAAIDVVLGDAHDESQVRLRHALSSVRISRPDLDGQRSLFFGGQQRVSVDIPEVCFETDFLGRNARTPSVFDSVLSARMQILTVLPRESSAPSAVPLGGVHLARPINPGVSDDCSGNIGTGKSFS